MVQLEQEIMKTILIPIDFSANADHAAEYGYNLAKLIEANVVLCNAVTIPAEMPQAGMVAWPMEEYDMLMQGSSDDLEAEKNRLQEKHIETEFKPNIDCVSDVGYVTDVVNGVAATHHIDMIVMGVHGSNGLNQFLLGNHARGLIDAVSKPLMLIPKETPVGPIKKIAFATDFNKIEADLEFIYQLIPLAKTLNAEILITHVYKESDDHKKYEKAMERFITELSNKADYPNIYYRIITNDSAEAGLDWICEHGQIDVLAMVHRPHSFFDSLLKGSHTKRMSNRVGVPLLVYQGK
jgi:nucleotide-binding universal stress UspA family protein